jgi:membrane protein
MAALSRNFYTVVDLLKDSILAWHNDHPELLAAGLGYFMLFSLGPLLVIATAIIGHLWQQPDSQRQILRVLSSVIGPQAGDSLARWLDQAGSSGKGNATILSALILVFGASQVFSQLRAALDMVWRVTPPKRGFVMHLAWTYLMDFGMMVVGMALFIVAFTATDALVALINHGVAVRLRWASTMHFLDFADTAVAFLLFAALFSAAYKLVPDTQIQWSDVWPGALFTSVLFIFGKYFVGLYLGRQSFGSVYGAASSAIVLMVWIYFAAQIFFFGAEFTRLYTQRFGSRAHAGR